MLQLVEVDDNLLLVHHVAYHELVVLLSSELQPVVLQTLKGISYK